MDYMCLFDLRKKDLVIDDIILDKSQYGNCKSISQEMPVPVINFVN